MGTIPIMTKSKPIREEVGVHEVEVPTVDVAAYPPRPYSEAKIKE